MLSMWVIGITGLAAIVEDIFRRRISNWISASAFLAGIGIQVREGGWPGILTGLAGFLAGGAVFLIFFLLGGMGAGDIKLMAGFGALVGPQAILRASLWIAGCGGVLAASAIAWGQIRPLLVKAGPDKTHASSGTPRYIPYAPAIAIGIWLSQMAKP